MFKQILDLLEQAVQVNLVWVLAAIICVALLYIINSALGFTIAGFQDEIDWKKLAFSQIRNIVMLICIFAVCYVLNFFALTINLIDFISIKTELITATNL